MAGDLAGQHRVAYDELLAKARSLGDPRAARELEEIGPPPRKDGRGHQVQRRWANLFEGADSLMPEQHALAPTAPAGRFAVPVFVIQGAEDFTTPTSLAKAFVDGVEAPHKAFVTLKGGHFAVFMNSSDFLKELSALLFTAAR